MMKRISLSRSKKDKQSSPKNDINIQTTTTTPEPIQTSIATASTISSVRSAAANFEKHATLDRYQSERLTTEKLLVLANTSNMSSPSMETKVISPQQATVTFTTSPQEFHREQQISIASPTASPSPSPSTSTTSTPTISHQSSRAPSPVPTPAVEDIFQFKSDPNERWYEPRSMSDITLYVELVDEQGVPTGTSITIHSHKQVLSVASIYFRTIFAKDMTIDEHTMPASFVYTRIHPHPNGQIAVTEKAVHTMFDLLYRTVSLDRVLASDPSMDIHLSLLVMCHDIHEATHVSDDIETDMVARISKFPTRNQTEAERLLHLLLVAQHLCLKKVALQAGQTLCGSMDSPAIHQLVVSCPLLDLVQSCHLRSALCATSASRVMSAEMISLSQELSNLSIELSNWRVQYLPLTEPKQHEKSSSKQDLNNTSVATHHAALLQNRLKALTILSEQIKAKLAKCQQA